ncbi:3-methyl-2-oxobutanoate hydroxymethyltransferase [Allomyces macrogynus ATCC 38327]|uniref:3-methyl-2-oxobutanoate hydroxymethyltransferase n=1 Tax=Allomyces macrogynus (strain ATCC 38327) TaxID=578462 RepID=A0A0L0SYU0_ALLM3|nr:3-methyl-2-oxobutanoate hydroxymethyltransferase [Allomyces macrogynus ATCC 38327]|eukprot:KNE67479.1 3-methyl-2-oxobutanoate hydroxymethyltransferase [Allomyces macrogynus ATCC 38327]
MIQPTAMIVSATLRQSARPLASVAIRVTCTLSTTSAARRITVAPARSYSSRPPVEAVASYPPSPLKKKITIQALQSVARKGDKITMITAHDYPTSLWAERAGAETILVGDSLAMVALGYDSTVSITLDEMLHHCRAVARGSKRAFLIADLPFGTYEACSKDAIQAAQRVVKEGNMEAVKIEGGKDMAETARAIVRSGIPVLGHIGLTPQRLAMLGGFRVQGKSSASAKVLVEDALALQDAGCFAVVLEAVPAPVAEYITRQLRIPTIGIGAGAGCSGQVLVQQDMLSIFDRFVPKFCKQYANMSETAVEALANYCREVKAGTFPAVEHTYPMPAEELAKFEAFTAANDRAAAGAPTTDRTDSE